MLITVCGEDSVSSRDYFLELQKKYKEKNYDVISISSDSLQMIVDSSQSQTLFGLKQIFITEGLDKKISRKKDNKIIELLSKIDDLKESVLIDWEEGIAQRDLKLAKTGQVKEFKPDKNIFHLLDLCYPPNLKNFLNLLENITTEKNEMFVYLMLLRHMRNLLLIKTGTKISSLQQWQLGKLSRQARYWKEDKLISFYDKLLGIDIAVKTGKSPYKIKDLISMLGCYFL